MLENKEKDIAGMYAEHMMMYSWLNSPDHLL